MTKDDGLRSERAGPDCRFKTLKAMTSAGSALACLIGAAAAQNTGGVFPPMVAEGEAAAEYRVTLRPADGADDGLAQRVHYQRATSDDLMWRVVVQAGGDTSDQAFRFVQGELFWDLSEDGAAWRTGLRFDGRVRDGGAPEQLGVNWTNQWALGGGWSARGILLTSAEIGDRARDGVGLETRANLFRQLENGVVLGVESYNPHGRTADLDLFGGGQQVGPFAFVPLGGELRLFAGALFGASGDAPDADYRVWLTKSF